MAMDRAKALLLAQRVLRVVQAIFAVIVLACASKTLSISNASFKFSNGPAGFLVFVSVTALLAAAFFLVVSLMEQLQKTFAGVVETSVSAVFVVFWLSASARFVSYTSDVCSNLSRSSYSTGYDSSLYGENTYLGALDDALDNLYQNLKSYCAFRSAAVAFGFLSWVLWMASTALAGLEMRAGKGLRIAGIHGNPAQNTQGGQAKSVETPAVEITQQQPPPHGVIYVQQPGPVVHYNQQPPMQAPGVQYTQQPPMQAPGMQYTQQPPIEPTTKTEV